MTTMLVAILLLLAAALFALMLYQHWAGTHPLLSLRNFALCGLVIVQIGSAARHLALDNFEPYAIMDPEATGMQFTAMVIVFTIGFIVFHALGWPTKHLARKTPVTRLVLNDSALIILAFVVTGLALLLRFAIYIPYVSIVASWAGTGFSAIAAGLAGWVWVKRWLNPAALGVAGFIVLINALIGITGAFGRRDLAAVALAFVWGAFYSRLRLMDMQSMLQRLAIIAAPPIIVLALFTAVRSHSDTSAMGVTQKMMQGDVKEGVFLLFEGQGTGAAAMWAIENYPERFDYRWFHTIYYFFTANIPRAMWEGKTVPLSVVIADQSNMEGVDQDDITVPPGIIGYAAAEGGWPAIIAYAIFFGLALRYFDELVVRHPGSPLVVLPVGCQLGQIVGLFRGDPSMFLNIFVFGFIGCYIGCVVFGKTIESRVKRREVFFQGSTAGDDANQTQLDAEARPTAENQRPEPPRQESQLAAAGYQPRPWD